MLRISISIMNSFMLLFYTQLIWWTAESVPFTSAQPQLLSGQDIGFTCGLDYCDRKGFVFCVAPPLVKYLTDAYCLSCEVKKNTCGTPNEVVGCNLYCQELLLNQSATKCEDTIKDMRKEMSQNHKNQSVTEYEETIKNITKDLQNMATRMETLTIVVIVMSLVIVVMLLYIILSRKPATKGAITSDHLSSNEKWHTYNENSDSLPQSLHSSKESGIEDVNLPLVNHEATLNGLTKKECLHSSKTGTLCYGADKLKNVQPVENGRVEIAVGNAKEHTIVPFKMDTRESGKVK